MSPDAELNQLIHKLRNVLNNITLHSEIAKLKLRTNQDVAGAEDALETIMSECEACGQMLEEARPDTDD